MSPQLTNYSRYTSYLRKTFLKPTSKNKTYLYLFLNFGAVLFFGWFAIRQTVFTITELLNEIKTQQEILTQIDDKIESFAAAKTSYTASEEKHHLANEALPSSSQVAEFTSQIEYLASQSDVQIVKLKFSPFTLDGSALLNRQNKTDDTKTNAWKELPFNLSVTGSYSQLSKLVHELYLSRRLILIDSLTFNSDKDTLTLNIKASGIFI